jgi:hypothetical protein
MVAKKKLESLRDEYLRRRDSLNEKELAVFERRLWEAAKRTFDSTPPRQRDWFVDEFGGQAYDYMQRSRLINFGDWVEPLWKYVLERDMPSATGIRLARKAKALAADKGLSNAESLSMIIEDYEHAGYLSVNADGKKVRRAHPTTRVRKPKRQKLDGFLDFDVTNTKKFNTALQAMISQFIEARLKGVEPSIKNELVADFDYCLRVLREDLMRDVNRLRAEQKKLVESERPSFRRFKRACEVLGVEAGSPTKLPNLSDLRKRYRDKAARFHPDRNNGDEQYVKQYHAVNQAWELIKTYYRMEK